MTLLLELLALASSFAIGIICIHASRLGFRQSTLLLWVGAIFLYISFLRTLSTLNFIDMPTSRLATGIFYPLMLVVIFLDRSKTPKSKV